MPNDESSRQITLQLSQDVMHTLMEVFPFSVEVPPEAEAAMKMARRERTQADDDEVKRLCLQPIAHDGTVMRLTQLVDAADKAPTPLSEVCVCLATTTLPRSAMKLGFPRAQTKLGFRIIDDVLLTTRTIKHPIRIRANSNTYQIRRKSVYLWVCQIK